MEAPALGWQAAYTVAVLAVLVATLVRDWVRTDAALMGALAALLLAGVVPVERAFDGFSSPAVVAVGALFVVAAAVQRTGALEAVGRFLLPRKAHPRRAQVQLMLSTSFLSGLLNNTPVVAMLIPRVQAWAEARDVPASKLLIPLSYAAILGGLLTLIGTSTNVVVSGLLEDAGYGGFGFFTLTAVGLPAALLGMLYVALIGHRLLPSRLREREDDAEGWRNCLFEVQVAPQGPLIGQNVDAAGLRNLGGAFLAHLRRDHRLLTARPDVVLRPGDTLCFVGSLDVLERLLARPGLERKLTITESLEEDGSTLPLYEAVVAEGSALDGRTLREAAFRERFGGVVLAVQRRDEQVSEGLGRIPLRAGDLLLIEAQDGFDKRWNARRDEFYLVAPRRGGQAGRLSRRAPLAMGLLVAMVVAIATGLLPLATATFAAALGVVATGCLRLREAARAVDLKVLLVIGAALGIGQALETTGLAGALASGLVGATAPLGPLWTTVALYLATAVLTELITHKAAAVLMVPVAIDAALAVGVDPVAFGLVVSVAAAASFVTPIGYQTNLMVMSAGGYRFTDYVRVGTPLALIVLAVTVAVVHVMWL